MGFPCDFFNIHILIMKQIDQALDPIDGYLISITRDTVNGWYELQVGLPSKWVFDDNNDIKCEILAESDEGKLVKISPKKTGIVIDDLVLFVKIIIKTNEMIVQKEKEFTETMEIMKGELENKAKTYYEELDRLREESFKKQQKELAKPEGSTAPKKRGRPKGSTNKKTQTVTEETEVLDSKK